jgi:hypothetical protein
MLERLCTVDEYNGYVVLILLARGRIDVDIDLLKDKLAIASGGKDAGLDDLAEVAARSAVYSHGGQISHRLNSLQKIRIPECWVGLQSKLFECGVDAWLSARSQVWSPLVNDMGVNRVLLYGQ